MLRKNCLWFVFGAVYLFGGIAAASAQVIPHPRPFVCMVGQPGCHTYPPSVTISPNTETLSSRSVAVTVTVCDSISVPGDSVVYNGVNKTSSFTVTSVSGTGQCAVERQLTATLTLNLGANTLQAYASNNFSGNPTSAFASVTYTYAPPPSVSVTPKGGSMSMPTSANDSVTFTVKNVESGSDSAVFTCSAPGITTSCSVLAGKRLAGGATAPIAVHLNQPSAATGTVTLIANMVGTLGADTGSIILQLVDRTRILRIVAASGIQQVLPGAPIVVPFTVTNNGNLPDTVTLSTACLGSALSGSCTASLTSIPLAPGASHADTVRVTAGTTVAATGTVGLVGALATAGVRDSAYTDITIRAARPRGVELGAVNDFSQQTPFLCYAHAVVPRAAYECGNLRIAHQLPAIRTYNKLRVPTLLYNSQLAHPHPVISAIITLDSTKGTPDSVLVQLQDGTGDTLGHGNWPGASFAHGASRQVSIGYDANGVVTNEYSWKVQAQAFYADTMLPYVTNEFYALVSAQTSHLGHGWTLAGIESMHIYSCGCSMIWNSGDGSAEFYSNQSTGSSTTFAPSSGLLTRPDTIKADRSTGVLRYIRYAPHGVQVIFDSTGRHIMTRDRLGHVTTMTYVNGSDVGSITVPAPGATLTYVFAYDATTHMLDSVIAPSTGGEPTRATKVTINGAGDVTAIRDPDGMSVTFNYRAGGDADVITSLVDRRGTRTAFTYDAARELATATVDSTSTGFKLTTSFAGADASTLTAALNPDSVSMLVNGPRTDVSDTTRIWVNHFGQPVRIRDALGYETDAGLTNPTFLARVTRLREPNGHVTGATYDSRGNLSIHADSSIFVGGAYATTNYAYDGKFDFVTTITPPLNDVTTFTYDTVNGNRLTEKNALGDSTTITYFYGNADSLVSSTQPPHTARDSIQYDGVFGNIVGQKTPLGYWTLTLLDGYGRDSMTITPIPAADKSHDPTGSGPVRDTINVLYDALDRPSFNQTISPTYNGVFRQASSVTTNYDGEGAVLSSQIALLPDPNNIQLITTFHFYDRVGRLSFTLHPDGSKDSLFYDAASNADTIYTRRGYKIAQAFDVLNRLTKRIVPSVAYPKDSIGIPRLAGEPSFYMTQNPPYGNLTIPGDSAAFGYDEVSNTVEADNADARISRVYDAAGRLLTETQRVRTRDGQNFSAHVYTITNGYDRDSRRTLLVHPSQLAAIVGGQARDTAIYGYDPAGHLQTVRDPLGGQFTYGYSARGDVVSLAFPDGATVERFGTDDDGRSTNDSIGPVSGPATARNTVLTYDARGKILTGVNAFGIKDNVTSTYSALGQIIAHNATYILPAIDGNPQSNATDNESYVLDPLGNHVSDTTFTNLQTGNAQDPTFSLALSGYRTNVGQQTIRQGGAAGIHGSADSLLYDPEGNLFMTYQFEVAPGDPAVDLASYYGADGRLRMADNRSVANPLNRNVTISTRALETYRYDALGRRVLKEADLWCANQTFSTACRRSTLRRIVWDGAQELDEIQEQDTSVVSIAEADTGVVQLQLQCSGDCQDNNKYFGRVLYTFGLTTDQPLAVTRVDYADATATVNGIGGSPVAYFVHPPLTFVPVWNAYGRWDSVLDYECVTMPGSSQPRCVDAQVEVGLVPYDNLRVNVISYMGSLLEDKRDETGTRYRRARTYNPTTGQFTQEDPAGLAGGLNAYGFTNGDPVNYSDPFGLCPPGDNDYSTCNPHRDLVLYVHGNTTAGGEIGLEGAVGAFAKNQAQLGLVDYLVLGVTGVMGAAGEAETSTGKMMGALREAASGKGNFGVGSLTAAEARSVGEAWVGEGATTASDGTTMVSKDGLRQFRPPSMKPNLGRVQANLEARPQANGAWQSNAHIDIVP